jgi:hypothetical protein
MVWHSRLEGDVAHQWLRSIMAEGDEEQREGGRAARRSRQARYSAECTYPWQLVDRLVATLLVGPAAAYAQDVSDAIREARPDLVACSMFCLGGMVAAEAAGIPFDVMLPNVYPFPRVRRRSCPALPV